MLINMCDLLWAVVLDWLIGDPPQWPHPVKWMGCLIVAEERWARRVATTPRALWWCGLGIVMANMVLTFGLTWWLGKLLRPDPFSVHLFNIYLLYACLAARCLRDEAVNVAHALTQNLAQARQQVARIVGRETQHLDEAEIVRATVETVAENTSDGVIAPLFYALIGGAPLALTYKMINTMDSMLGYLNERYRDLGFFPAKVDDAANFVPARLTGLGMNLASIGRFPVARGLRVMWRDRRNHKSPNCAYPEGAVAGLLGVQLGGSNVYFGQIVAKPTIGDRTRALEPADITRTVNIMFRAEMFFIACALAGWFFLT